MTFQDLFSVIRCPRLRAVAGHWEMARGVKKMPAWRDIDPIAIAPHLSIIWAWRYDCQTDAFTGRLAGEEITAIFQKSLRGVPMEKFFHDWEYAAIFARYKQVLTEPAFMHGSGRVFSHAARYGIGERIILPLADDGENGDGILGATTYAAMPNPADDEAPAEDHETVEFFPLG